LCEPLFQYICRLNRSARQHGNASAAQVRADIMAMLADARKRAAAGGAAPGGPSVAEQWKQVEPALLFFVDFMIRTSRLPFASRWDDLARELNNEMSGDEKFFDLLEVALADRSDAGAERLAVFYTCIGLGFSGFYTGQPEYLRRKMLDCSSRIRNMIDAGGKVCPDAYENVNTADLIESPGKSIVGIVIALVGLTLVLFIANGYWYRNSVKSLQSQVSGLSSAVQSSPNHPASTPTQER
jgi:type VI protein secretion system component VasF